MPATNELTPSNLSALRALRRVLKRRGTASLEEWAEEYGVTYGGIVQQRRRLARLGYVTATPGRTRSTRLTKKALDLLH